MSTPVKKLGNLFQIGTQLDLPLKKIGDIAWRNMKHRFGRSLVTTSGVILATAFLMAMLLKNSVVGAMLEATRSLKNVVVDVELTRVQADNIVTVLKNEKSKFETALKDSTEILDENNKTTATTQEDLKQLQAKLAALQSPDGKPLAGREKDWRNAQDAVKQRERDLQIANETVKAAEEKVAIDKTQMNRAEYLLKNVKPGWKFSTQSGTNEERAEAVALAQFLQRLGKQLENELQSHSVQDAPVGSRHAGARNAGAAAIPAAAAAVPAVAAAAGPVVHEADSSAGAPKDLWLTGLALVVAGVGITNAMLMSVTERFREIGTMKCLGALDSFILKLFLIESTVQGGMGTLAGMVLGVLLMVAYLFTNFGGMVATYWPWDAFGQNLLVAFGAGVVISVIGAAFPSLYASRMDPIAAMRQEI
ncbi:MAG TPA: FtsX-like permease family protein [Planctomycetota bacterium]|nr:FtsX-like permease family protein [Planctomycetota bacterium]